MGSKEVNLSIVIINMNSKYNTLRCLKSIFSQEQEVSYEVFVIDNASNDGSPEAILEAFPDVCMIVNSKQQGFAANNNKGLARAQGRYLMILNNDTLVLPGALKQMVNFMDAYPNVGLCGPKILNPDREGIQYTCGRRFPTLLSEFFQMTGLMRRFPNNRVIGRYLMAEWDHCDTREVDSLLGACEMIRRETMDEIGLMDERYFLYGEDIDWCYQAKKHDWKVYLVADAEIVHFGGQTMKQQPTDSVYLESLKSKYLYFVKNHSKIQALVYRTLAGFIHLSKWLMSYIEFLWSDNQEMERLRTIYWVAWEWAVGLRDNV